MRGNPLGPISSQRRFLEATSWLSPFRINNTNYPLIAGTECRGFWVAFVTNTGWDRRLREPDGASADHRGSGRICVGRNRESWRVYGETQIS
jgi:hypothetical protein